MILPQAITDDLRPGILAPFHENGSRPLSYEAFLVVLFPARYFLMHSPGMLTIYTYHHTRRGGRMVLYNSLWANSPGRGRKGKESLQLCLWNLNTCIKKVNAKCWLVEMTVTTSLPLACVFQCLFTLILHSFLLRLDWWKCDSSVDGEPQGNWRWNSNSRDVFASSPSFSRPALPRRACSQATPIKGKRTEKSTNIASPPPFQTHVFWSFPNGMSGSAM